LKNLQSEAKGMKPMIFFKDGRRVIKAHGECVKHIYVIDVDSVDDTDDNKL
jgi:hypothetical protein